MPIRLKEAHMTINLNEIKWEIVKQACEEILGHSASNITLSESQPTTGRAHLVIVHGEKYTIVVHDLDYIEIFRGYKLGTYINQTDAEKSRYSVKPPSSKYAFTAL